MSHSPTIFILQALLPALFGASEPLVKLLLGEIAPVTLAGLLYLGSGIGVLLIKLVQGLNMSALRFTSSSREKGSYCEIVVQFGRD
jgi:hypothetical protein